MDLLEEFRSLRTLLLTENLPFALCGGLALGVHGLPRATIDIDLLIHPEFLERVKAVAARCGFQLDTGLMTLGNGKAPIYRMVKFVPGEKFPLILDLLLVTEATEGVWRDRITLASSYGEIPVVSPQGLIQLKQLRNSDQDRVDIQNLKALEI